MDNYQNEQEPPKRFVKRYEVILIIIAVLIMLYLGNRAGCSIIGTEDKVEWIDR